MQSRVKTNIPCLIALAGLLVAVPAPAQKIIEHGADTARVRTDRAPEVPRLPEIPELPELPEPPEVRVEVRTIEGDSVRHVIIRPSGRRGEEEAAIVRMGENIVVEENEIIDGDVVSIGGSITVYGRVRGDAVSIGGTVRLKGEGAVEGDAVAIGGTVESPANRIGGQQVGMRFLPAIPVFAGLGFDGSAAVGLLFFSAALLFTFLVGWLLVAVAGRRVAAMGTYIQENLWKSLFTGIAVLLLSPAAFALLIVTLVGIPLAFLMPVLVPLAFLIGFLVVSVLVGMRLVQDPSPEPTGRVKPLAVGILVFFAPMLLGQIAHFGGGALDFIGSVLMIFGWAAGFIVSCIGVGSMVLSRLGRSARDSVPVSPAGAIAAPQM